MDLLACLADAAAGAPSIGQVGILQRQALERTAAGQAGPCNVPQPGARRHLSNCGRVSPSPPAEVDGGHHVEREVSVICNGTFGTFLIPSQTVECHCARCNPAGPPATGSQGLGNQQHLPAITPTEFERHSGLLTAKKWRNSIRLVQGDGIITIGKWLEQHNILPRPKCSGGPLGSPGTGGSGSAVVMYGFPQHAADAHYHTGGPSGGNDSQACAAGGGLADLRVCSDPHQQQHHHHHHQQAMPALRCTLPASRYPASEYITGEYDEYDEVGARLGGAEEDGDDGDAAAGGDGEGDDDDYADGHYLDALDGHGGAHAGRGGRRNAAHRSSRSGNGGQRFERRGTGRGGAGRHASQALGRTLLARQRARYAGRGGMAGLGMRGGGASGVDGGAALGPQLRGPGSGGSGAVDPRRGSGRGGGASSGEDDGGGGGGGGGGGVKLDHSSSEGSPPSDDSKRRDGSGGSGEGDGSGTGDVGDSRRPLPPPGADGERRHYDGIDPSSSRRAHRGTPGGKPQQPTGGEGSADGGAAQDRGARHATAVKRLPPEYLTGAEIGPTLKRARTRPAGAAGSAAGGGAGVDDLAAMYDMTAALPQVCGWSFLGPAADRVLISVTINGRSYTGLLAPQPPMSPVPCRPPPAAPAVSNGTCSGRKSGLVRTPAASCGRGLQAVGRAAGAVDDPATTALVLASADTAVTAAEEHHVAQPNAPAPPPLLEDEPPDDGMPHDCPRCALCRRAAVPTLAPPPPPPPKLAPAPSATAAAPPAAAGDVASAVPAVKADTDAATEACKVEAASASATAAAAVDGTNEGTAATLSEPPQPELGLQSGTVTTGDGASDQDQRPGTAGATNASKNSTTEEAGAAVSGGDETWSISALPAAEEEAEARQQVPSVPPASPKPSQPSQPPSQAQAVGDGSGAGGGGVGQGSDGCKTVAAAAAATAFDGVTAAAVASGAGAKAGEVPEVRFKTEEGEGPGEQPSELKTETSAPTVDAARVGSLWPAAPAPTPAPAPAPCREASRTQRQTGCGLGPLVEVKGGCGGGAADVGGAVLVHSQCALWSPDVFVIGGALYGVPAVIKLGRSRRCAHCGRSGATLSCCNAKCLRAYHLPCALEAGAMLVAEPYSMACPDHRNTLAAAAHPASSCQPPGRLPASRLRPAQSQDASLSTTTTTATAGGTAAGAKSGQPQHPQPPQQVALPRSLQMSSGRRVVLPPVGALPPPSAEAAAAAPRLLRSNEGGGGGSLPALMMLRSQADGSAAATAPGLPPMPMPPPSSCMPPPRAGAAATAAPTAAAAAPGGRPCTGSGGDERESTEAGANRKRGGPEDAAAAGGDANADVEASGPAAVKRHRTGGEGPVRQGEEGCQGAQEGVAAGGLVFGPGGWFQGQQHVFERRQAAAAAAAVAGGGGMGGPTAMAAMHAAVTLSGLYGSALPAGMSSAQVEMSVASDGTMAVNSQSQGQGGGVKRRWEGAEAASNAADAAVPGATAIRTGEGAFSGGDVATVAMNAGAGAGGGEEGTAAGGAVSQSPHHPRPQASGQGTLPLLPPMGLGGVQLVGVGMAAPPTFLSLGAAAAASENGVEVDAHGNLCLTHAAALALLQQQQNGGAGPGGIPEGMAMMLAQGQKHGGGGVSGGGGEGSVGSPLVPHPVPRGMPGGGGRPRHHPHQQHHHHQQAVPGTSASTASASTGTAYGGRAGGGGGSLAARSAGGAGDESPSHPQQRLSALQLQLQQQQANMTHVLPRAARNIEGLLPARPLLHNPYVPSSGDPSADLTLSKIAQTGSREVEAELLGGTTGRAGHSGRCAVCVIQRKGKCGTESAPKKCLRRQLVALQRATGGSGGASGADDVEELPYTEIDPAVTSFMDERAAAAAAQQRARERERRETWSLPLGQGSGATGKRPPQHFAAV